MFRTLLNLFKSHHLKLISIESEAQNAYTFKFEKGNINYQAGQHFVFRLKHEDQDKRGNIRIFSASSAPSEDYLSITTRYFGEDSSSFKRSMMSLEHGQTISVRGPSPLADVYKVKDYSKPHVYIAGGIGITPFRSVLVESLHQQKDLQGKLFYANRDEDFIFGQEIEEGVARLPNFELEKVLSPNRISTEQLQETHQQFDGQAVFVISGKIAFVENYEKMLKEIGVSSSQIRAYKYRGLFGSYK